MCDKSRRVGPVRVEVPHVDWTAFIGARSENGEEISDKVGEVAEERTPNAVVHMWHIGSPDRTACGLAIARPPDEPGAHDHADMYCGACIDAIAARGGAGAREG